LESSYNGSDETPVVRCGPVRCFVGPVITRLVSSLTDVSLKASTMHWAGTWRGVGSIGSQDTDSSSHRHERTSTQTSHGRQTAAATWHASCAYDAAVWCCALTHSRDWTAYVFID